jgi:hypothetical protein
MLLRSQTAAATLAALSLAATTSAHVEQDHHHAPAAHAQAGAADRDRDPLHLAAIDRSSERVMQLLQQGADPNTVDADGRTPLHYAALLGDQRSVLALIEEGASLEATDRWGEIPLHAAARRLRSKITMILLDAGSDAAAVNLQGQTALHLAAEIDAHIDEMDADMAQVAALLVQSGADVNASDDNGYRALSYALEHDRPLLADVLIDAGAIEGAPVPHGHHHHRNVERSVYRTYTQIEAFLTQVANDHPSITQRYTLVGQTPGNRVISAIRISDNPTTDEDEPAVRYISTMHGDEIVGNEMCLYFIDYLTDNYAQPGFENITALVDDLDIWIVPLMNPDGYVAGQRGNSNGVDLNRNFPDPYTSPSNTPAGRQPETGIIMDWLNGGETFTLSANLHGGALLVNYPFDNNPSGSSVYTASPDDDVFIYASLAYAQLNPPMYNSPSFPNGITNGADWYAISGGMQDWNYHYLGNNEITIELSNTKGPSASTLGDFWDDNRDSMVAYLECARIGVRGIVTVTGAGVPLAATVSVEGRNHEIPTDPDVGNYHRMLLPGTYDLLFQSPGFDSQLVENVVVSSGDATRLDIAMGPAPFVTLPNGGESFPAQSSTTVQWTGLPGIQYHVQHTSNYGNVAQDLDGFESGSLGPDYALSGDASWSATTSNAYNGVRSARSGSMSNNQSSIITRTVTGPTTLRFWYSVSSEQNYDFFRFAINGVEEVAASGSVGWTEYTKALGPGTHTLRWSYEKDISVSSGSDTAWIDDVSVEQDNTVWTDITPATAAGASSTPWTPSTETTTAKVRLRALYPSGALGAWDESDAVFTINAPVPVDCPGDINGDDLVTLDDFTILASNFGGGPGLLRTDGDLTGDGFVDLADFTVLATNFGADCTAP